MNWTPDVALFTRWLSGGGAERVMANLANGLAERGLRVDLLVIQSRQEVESTFHPNIRLIDLAIQPLPKKNWLPATGFQSWQSLPKLVDYLQTYCPPVLLSATHFINETALLAKKLSQVPTRIVVTEHTFLSQEVRLTEQVSSRLIPWTVRVLYASANDIVAVSHGVAKDLQQFIGRQQPIPTVIYNPVVTSEMMELAQQPIDHPWFQHKEQPIVIGAGRFVRQKDFGNLLRAFAHLRQTVSARLVLLGDGREYKQLKQLALDLGIADDLWMPGFVDNPYAFLQKADVFALSSAWEGLPTVLIEAIALGVPVVATDCPSGPMEILQGGAYGRLVPVRDAEALGTALQEVLRDGGPVVPEAWIQQFMPEQVIQRYIEVMGLIVPGRLATGAKPQAGVALGVEPAEEPATVSSVPLVSVIIPAYNAADLLPEALDSVKHQTYRNWEIIVVEDGTQDGTEAIVKRFAEAVAPRPVRYVRHPKNKGLSAARNTGMSAAQGEYIALLDHDDLWYPQHLSMLVKAIAKDNADIAYAHANFFDYNNKKDLGLHGPQQLEWSNFPNSLLNRNYIPASSVMMKCQVPRSIGGFDTKLRRVEDLDYWLRCAEARLKFTYVSEVTNGYRQRNPNAMTSNKPDILEWHARVLRKHAKIKGVSSKFRDRVLARYHFGVARRSWPHDLPKAGAFLFHALLLAPMGSMSALKHFFLEMIGKEHRHDWVP
jgi:glycosyltransferase involved in cell wall biosynthesis